MHDDEAGQCERQDQLAELQVLIGQLQARAELATHEIATLHEALKSARRIGAAIGIIMAASKTTEEQAFDTLRQASQNHNRKLRDLADDVVHTGALPG